MRFFGNVVLLFAGSDALAATYTFMDVYPHRIIMLRRVILIELLAEK